MEYASKREKKLLLSKYKEQQQDIKTAVYRIIKNAAELERPHDEMERLVALSKGFDSGWYTLDRELSELEGKD